MAAKRGASLRGRIPHRREALISRTSKIVVDRVDPLQSQALTIAHDRSYPLSNPRSLTARSSWWSMRMIPAVVPGLSLRCETVIFAPRIAKRSDLSGQPP